ncbi:uncharacterized protein I206_107368 [Kwoniella pini CBS 10737]|uniref:Uncharacterized protein n=1 Tax=Kwoniella pini CBS 10737 TaxID=1296096 RepID=A0AAJ8MT23_9TREE
MRIRIPIPVSEQTAHCALDAKQTSDQFAPLISPDPPRIVFNGPSNMQVRYQTTKSEDLISYPLFFTKSNLP